MMRIPEIIRGKKQAALVVKRGHPLLSGPALDVLSGKSRRQKNRRAKGIRRIGIMYIIAGLGNPGKQYEHTRHNVGFEVIDRLAERMGISVEEKKHKALCGRGVLEGEKVVLLKPQTFMNLSGESVRAAADYYKVPPQQVLVIYDDISLEPGQLRIRAKGSAGGHNGMKNIIAHLGTQEYPRVRVGIGDKPRGMDLADYVLSRFSKGEQEKMEQAFAEAAEAAAMIAGQGLDKAMNHFNQKKQEQEA